MSDDLISRKLLAEEIESLGMTITGLRTGKSIVQEVLTEYKKSVLRIIEEQPTAFDKEKVIEELKEEGCIVDDDAGNRAVEIIEKGGIE